MDNKVIGLLGALSLASMDPSRAATPPNPSGSALPQAQSYAELLDPVPDAVALLRADDLAVARAAQPEVMLAQYHHHHHHHHRYRRHYHHHHHHHHHY